MASGVNMAMAPATGTPSAPQVGNSTNAQTRPTAMPAQTPAAVVRFQNRPNRYGAKNTPAKVPQLMTIRLTMTAGLASAISSESPTNTTHNPRISTMVRRWFLPRSTKAP